MVIDFSEDEINYLLSICGEQMVNCTALRAILVTAIRLVVPELLDNLFQACKQNFEMFEN